MACAPEKPTFCASVTTTVKSLIFRAATESAELVADEEAASVVKVEADRQPPTPWSHILACVMVCVVLRALIGCEMFFDVPEYFQLAWSARLRLRLALVRRHADGPSLARAVTARARRARASAMVRGLCVSLARQLNAGFLLRPTGKLQHCAGVRPARRPRRTAARPSRPRARARCRAAE